MGFKQELTKRELEICGLVSKGLSSENIAKTLYLSEGTIKNHISSIFKKTGVQNRAQLAAQYVVEYEQAVTDIDRTWTNDSDSFLPKCAKLKLAGLYGLPDSITLNFSGQSFIIGRFDISIGQKQCDFEFAKSTKAVSRRHASIESTPRGLAVMDLGSRAGTFVNGNRLIPGESRLLRHGDHVSFGNAGADYIFEE